MGRYKPLANDFGGAPCLFSLWKNAKKVTHDRSAIRLHVGIRAMRTFGLDWKKEGEERRSSSLPTYDSDLTVSYSYDIFRI